MRGIKLIKGENGGQLKLMNETKEIYIHSAKMAGWLMLNGHMFKRTEVDWNNTNRTVFVFADTYKIRDIMGMFAVKDMVQICTTLLSRK